MKVLIGSGSDLSDDTFYTVTIGLNSGIAIGKLAGDSRQVTSILKDPVSMKFLLTEFTVSVVSSSFIIIK